MGVYTSSLHMHETLSESEFLEIETGNFYNFWEKCDEHASRVQHCLSENQDLTFLADSDKTIEYFNQSPATPQNPNNLNFVLSSIGIMRNTDAGEILKIEEAFFRMKRFVRKARRFGYTLFVAAATIDAKLCVSLSFNEDYISTEIVGELIREIKILVDAIDR
jgi:hypothetical protein